jgi:exopolyphosphatase/guanosine-5'-triphosphate,3'-diphosphate pyrophosphatase
MLILGFESSVMKIAVIDLGTNTFNLLIVEKDGKGGFRKTYSNRIPVKLGEGAINKGYIEEIPYNRGISALQHYTGIIKEKKVDQVYAYATSAIRTAANGKEFVKNAMEKTGIKVEIIDGNREAELIYFGNREAVKMNEELSLIMDIGGGSTEFIIANKQKIFWKHSFLLGAARLLEKIRPSDPITPKEINQLNAYLKQELVSLFDAVKEFKPVELIGSSGAFDSIVDMMAGEYETEALCDHKTEYDIDLSGYYPLSQKIIQTTLKERYFIKGLIEMRVDMIVISCLFVNFILEEFNLKRLRVSTYSLKEGVLYSL